MRFFLNPKEYIASCRVSGAGLKKLETVVQCLTNTKRCDIFLHCIHWGRQRLCVQAFDVSVPEWANNREKLARIADEFDVLEFQPKESTDATDVDGDDREAVIEKLCPLRDDGSYHMELILALANLRAKSYGIPEVDNERAKIIARRTTPEGASTGTATPAPVLQHLPV
ncbi:hypothetical protein L1887_05561 [Cichorium endivia]|nr:hypothetical protein L1887_05561 [Cichorium endivia]